MTCGPWRWKSGRRVSSSFAMGRSRSWSCRRTPTSATDSSRLTADGSPTNRMSPADSRCMCSLFPVRDQSIRFRPAAAHKCAGREAARSCSTSALDNRLMAVPIRARRRASSGCCRSPSSALHDPRRRCRQRPAAAVRRLAGRTTFPDEHDQRRRQHVAHHHCPELEAAPK